MLRRRQVIERLKCNLESLESYCRSDVTSDEDVAKDGWTAKGLSAVFRARELGCCPDWELLQEIRDDVLFLYFLEHKKLVWPMWKAFKYVDSRMKNLQLELRVNDLISRWLTMRSAMRSIESELSKAAKEPKRKETQRLLCDIGLGKQDLFELLVEDRLLMKEWYAAKLLVYWVIEIRHPRVEDVNNIVEFFESDEELKAVSRRERELAGNRERVRKYRRKQKHLAE